MTQKFKEGTTVSSKIAPGKKLLIRKFQDDVYYCVSLDEPEGIAEKYSERELQQALFHGQKI